MEESSSYIMMSLFLSKEDFDEINHVLKYHVTSNHFLGTILGTVTVEQVSVTYKLNSDYSIGIILSHKGKTKLPYRLFLKRLEDLNDVININKKKHQLQITHL